MTTWVVGDIHGCAAELERLIARLKLGPEDTLVCVGDLFHRGPDPLGVLDQLSECRARFVLGNHELAVLRRVGLAPTTTDEADRPPLRADFPEVDASDLDGDGHRPCANVSPERRVDVLRFLQRHDGFALRSSELEHAGSTPDGAAWVAIHAGVVPGTPLDAQSIRSLTTLRHLDAPGKPWWYESWRGPELVLFGHTPSPVPRAHQAGGRLVALGLDTGCVYGGRLTAYSPDEDELVAVRAERAYARA